MTDRFSADLDRLLEQRGCAEEPVSDEYAELLDVARRLASLDFSAGRPLRAQLRRNLLARYDERQRHRYLPVWPGWRLRWQPAVVGLAVLLCIALFAFTPAGRTLAQGGWQTVLRTVQLVRAVPQLSSDDAGTVTTQVTSPAEAIPLVDFPVRVPSYLPPDYRFRYGWVSQLPQQGVFFTYGIPAGSIVILPNGQAVSSETFQGLAIYQMKGKLPGPWPIGEATVEEVMVDEQPALWLKGLPAIRSSVRLVAKVTLEDGEPIERKTLSRQESPEVVVAHTPATALVWEEGDLLLSLLDLEGRFPLAEMTRIAEGLVPVSTLAPEELADPTPRPEMKIQTITDLEEMTAQASFSPFVLDPLPQGWQLERITAFSPSDRPQERWYTIQYRHSQGASIRLTEGLMVALQLWTDDIERTGGTLRHTTTNGLEVWTSDLHQGTEERMAKENARLNERPVPNEVQAMFLRATDGFSLELIAIDVPWDEAMALIEHLTLAPGADPGLNRRLMQGCSPCP